jgi:hypothetical protein
VPSFGFHSHAFARARACQHKLTEGAEVVAAEPFLDAVLVEEVATGEFGQRRASGELFQADDALLFLLKVESWLEEHLWKACTGRMVSTTERGESAQHKSWQCADVVEAKLQGMGGAY